MIQPVFRKRDKDMFCAGTMVFIYIYLDIARYSGIYYSVGPSYNKKKKK